MTYYIKIESPREFRRDLLEGSKKVISCLQDYRNVSYIRERKKQLMLSLRDELKEISLLVAELDKLMPEKQLREEAKREQKAQEEAKKVAERKAKEAQKKAELAAQKAREDAFKEKKVEEETKKKTPTKKTVTKKSEQKNKKKTPTKQETNPTVEEKPKPVSEMDRLNDALANIEKKLQQLE